MDSDRWNRTCGLHVRAREVAAAARRREAATARRRWPGGRCRHCRPLASSGVCVCARAHARAFVRACVRACICAQLLSGDERRLGGAKLRKWGLRRGLEPCGADLVLSPSAEDN